MVVYNLWNDFRPEHSTSYPYETRYDVGPRSYTDMYQRSMPRLVASLAHFGELFRLGEATLDATQLDAEDDIQKLLFAARIFSDSTRPEDFLQFTPQFAEANRLVLDAQILFERENRTDEFPDLTPYEQIIYYHHINPNKWVVFLVLPKRKTSAEKTPVIVEAFFIGGVELADVDDMFLPIIAALGRSFPLPMVEWRRRCHVPESIFNDNVFLTFLFIHYLQRNGNYLDLTPEKIWNHKLQAFPGMKRYHDLWLGQLQINKITPQSHPFVKPRSQQTNLSDFERLGWVPIDVRGDGNCGYYSLILGLENIGYYTFSVWKEDDDDSASNLPRPKKKKNKKASLSMRDNIQWQEQIVQMRRKLQEHSNWLLWCQYPRSGRDYSDLMWFVSGAITAVQVDGTPKELAELEAANEQARKQDKDIEIEKIVPLSDQFLMEGAEIPDYFTDHFREELSDFHMNPYWATHVLASTLEMRVIIYMMDSSDPRSPLYNVTTFDHQNAVHTPTNPHVKVTWESGLTDISQLEKARINDVEFKEKPTIEILYEYAYADGQPTLQHFQFLRRVLCSGIPTSPDPSQVTLRDMLQSDSMVNDPWERVVVEAVEASEQIRDPVRPAEKRGKQVFQPSKASGKKTKKTIHAIVSKGKPILKSVAGKGRKRSSKAEKNQRTKETKELNKLYKNGELPAMRMYYDSISDEYYICHFDRNKGVDGDWSAKELVLNIENCHPFLVQVSTRHPNEWTGPPLGDPGDGVAPGHLNTQIITIYQQHGNRYCLSYSLASALFYCGFKWEAQILAEQARNFAGFHYDEAISELKSFMLNLVPLIGLPTLFGIRTKRHSRIKRKLTWEDLFVKTTPFPTVVIPRAVVSGTTTHAFCVVDDLIFDSITPQAMKLREETFSGYSITKRLSSSRPFDSTRNSVPLELLWRENIQEKFFTLHWEK